MSKLTKNQKIAYAKVEAGKLYKLPEAAALLKEITFTKFDASVDVDVRMGKVGALGRILGPRGLMPNPKTGTVTMDVAKAVQEVKAGKIDFKVDKFGIVHTTVGKISFTAEQIVDNAKEVLNMILKLKPAAAKGSYVKSIYLSTTMSPGLQIDAKSVETK